MQDGKSVYCKPCAQAYGKEYYERNKEQQQKESRERYYAHRKERMETVGQYGAENKKKVAQWRRIKELKKKYGLSKQECLEMFTSQHGRCIICANSFTFSNPFCVDHDHRTGKVRGLLCRKCNSLLGFARDDLGLLKRASNYIHDHLTGTSRCQELLDDLRPSQLSLYSEVREYASWLEEELLA